MTEQRIAVRDVGIDIRIFGSHRIQEPFEKQAVFDRIHVCDAKHVIDQRTSAGSASCSYCHVAPSNINNLLLGQEILREFSCTATKSTNSDAEKELVRQALLIVSRFSDYQILGICADTASDGISALASYSKALGYATNMNLNSVAGAVYIKFNPKTGLCYLDSYAGNHRGVLVSCQSDDAQMVNEMYGHLPIDLF